MIEAGKTQVAVDQFTKRIGTVRRQGWFPIGSEPTVEVTDFWDKVTVVGAVTHEGESFDCLTEENLTAARGIRLLKALLEEFGEALVVLLGRVGYFYARDRWEFVSGERNTDTVGDSSVTCVRSEALEVWYFPPKLPGLNPMEGCWNYL